MKKKEKLKEKKILNINKNKKQIKNLFFKCKNLNRIKKINLKLFFYEFFVKIIKEIVRIRWINKNTLGYKFLITIIFIFIFIIFYLFLDLFLHYLLTISYII